MDKKKSLEELIYELEISREHFELLLEYGVSAVETVCMTGDYNKEEMHNILLKKLPKDIKQLEKEIKLRSA